MKKFYKWLETRVFPKITTFYAHPIMILSTILLFVPMVTWQTNVVLILLLNSWMNVGSFSTSQITLMNLLQTADEQEKRAVETHDCVMEELDLVKEELTLAREERDELKQIMAEVHKQTKGGIENVLIRTVSDQTGSITAG